MCGEVGKLNPVQAPSCLWPKLLLYAIARDRKGQGILPTLERSEATDRSRCTENG